MQDIRSVGNGAGTLFAGGSDRRLNPNNHHVGCLNCPRCGSLNTKFCYYNNYNLSQPRFLCKSCRRYWTNGGVLRNVPVGGGSRKTKRSKQSTGNRKPSSTDSHNSTSDISFVAANISPETTATSTPTAEAAPTLINQTFEPPMLDQCSTDNHRLFLELPQEFISATEISPSTQNRGEEQGLENQRWSNGGGAAEDWGVFDQSYWLNNSEYQLNYLM